ncbi:unnamed protein product [Ceratitis capitata]|uniref:(Mediterranean fruit fly) hypothetical protein n=1 Tax=Ceratitis capitata TaxID=7213 RepID=A0A811VAC9_CERCA|nr:unnamed protein product [Ceratitis capitata]
MYLYLCKSMRVTRSLLSLAICAGFPLPTVQGSLEMKAARSPNGSLGIKCEILYVPTNIHIDTYLPKSICIYIAVATAVGQPTCTGFPLFITRF